jgi:16S rRNA (cytosine967-C5)-methyltransferase
MAAELLFHGTPAHAAVDMGVRLARDGKGTSKLSGLINAVGRRLAEQGSGLVEQQDDTALNMPGWLRHRLVQDWGMENADAIGRAHLNPAPHDLTLANPDDLKPLASETGAEILPTGGLRLPDRPQITNVPGYTQGAWWVQDAAAAMPAKLIPAAKDGRVLDLCAAPGGKTMQLAAAGLDVTALDASEARMQRLLQNLARTRLSAQPVVADALDWEPDARFDAIFLDAPCSATGTIRRHPDLPHRVNGRGVAQLADVQAKLLDRAVGWLRPGGVLVYCTCSLLKSEGEHQAKAFAQRCASVEPLPIMEVDGIPAEFVDSQGWLRSRPDHWADRGGLDGFFAARFRCIA